MPALESTGRVAPRSALRHRSFTGESRRSSATTASWPTTRRASRPQQPYVADDELVGEWKRGDANEPLPAPKPQSKTQSSPRRASGNTAQRNELPVQSIARPARHLHAHPVLFLGLGMLAMLTFWTLLTAGLNWWSDTMDYLHYGYPRTFQIDASVGHNDSPGNPSHFLSINLRGKIEVIEFPGGDSSHARVYSGPQLFGPGTDKVPVTLRFVDINGDHRPDMLLFFQSSWIIFINDSGGFRAPTEQEHQEAAQYLTAHPQ